MLIQFYVIRLTDTTMSTVNMIESPMGSVVPIQVVMPTTGNGLLNLSHRYNYNCIHQTRTLKLLYYVLLILSLSLSLNDFLRIRIIIRRKTKEN